MPVRPRADIRKPHPAKFSEEILQVLDQLLAKYEVEGLVLDPFAGVGRVHELRNERIQTVGVEIEPEWARWHPDTICDDARNVPKLFKPGEVSAIVTSPTYGNRMADHHEAMDGSRRHTYKEYLERDVSTFSTASMQWGCLVPGSRVLRGDWRWVPVETLQAGDELIGFDEEVPPGLDPKRGRRFRPSAVEAVAVAPRECVEVTFDDGLVQRCTTDHPWLSRQRSDGGNQRAWGWTPAGSLRPGEELGIFLPTWEEDSSWSAGWLAGMFDGEGSLSHGPTGSSRLQVAQRPGEILDRLQGELSERGFTYRVDGGDCLSINVLGGFSEQIRLLGAVRPERLLSKVRLDGRQLKAIDVRRVVDVRAVGQQDVVLMGTTTKTYLAEGMGSHNSEYRDSHYILWSACLEVLADEGYLFLNGSNHIRNWREQPVVEAHVQMLLSFGMFLREVVPIETRRLGHGANRDVRVPNEVVVVLQKRPADAVKS